MKIRTLFSSVLFICTTGICLSQTLEIFSDTTKFKSDFDIGFGSYYQFSSFGNTNLNTASFPESIGRRIDDNEVRRNWNLDNNQITDSPLFHGSYFLKIGGSFGFGPDFNIAGTIIGEQRGFSDGIFSDRTRNIYTYLNARYSKNYGKFSYFIQAGDFWNFKLYEGLTYNNLETQSWIFKLKYGKFYIKHAGIGDLLVGYGLGIDDLYDYSFGFERLEIGKSKNYLLDMRAGTSNNRGSINGGFNNISLKIKMPNDLSIYSQISSGFNGQGSAFLLGSELNSISLKKFELKSKIEFRNYSSGFNEGYTSTVYYRNPNESSNYTNSRNRSFVPIDFFEREFNQWAVYTEYLGQNVSGVSCLLDVRYNLFRNSSIVTEFDITNISSISGSQLYLFYDFGYFVEPLEELEISLTLTNRVLNLDKNYPTLYQSTRAYFLLRMYKPLIHIQDRNELHRL